jgi:hypothetical protein
MTMHFLLRSSGLGSGSKNLPLKAGFSEAGQSTEDTDPRPPPPPSLDDLNLEPGLPRQQMRQHKKLDRFLGTENKTRHLGYTVAFTVELGRFFNRDFCGFRQCSAIKLAIFTKINVLIIIWHKLAVHTWSQIADFFADNVSLNQNFDLSFDFHEIIFFENPSNYHNFLKKLSCMYVVN